MREIIDAGQISVCARVVLIIRVIRAIPSLNECRDLGKSIPQIQNSCRQEVGVQIVKGDCSQRRFCIRKGVFTIDILVIISDTSPNLLSTW